MKYFIACIVSCLLAIQPGTAQQTKHASMAQVPSSLDEPSPLYIVDGKAREFLRVYVGEEKRRRHDPAWDLNPYDVETITGLRGEQAVLLFGEKARFGAVIITTRRALRRKG